jgi:hypothetical protein
MTDCSEKGQWYRKSELPVSSDPASEAISALCTGPSNSMTDTILLQRLMKWHTTFSLHWYRQFCVSRSVLENTLRLLFFITEFPNKSISVASFNAIGGLLVVLAPFHAEEVIEALSRIISDLPPSPNTSILIVSTFVFLSHRRVHPTVSDHALLQRRHSGLLPLPPTINLQHVWFPA